MANRGRPSTKNNYNDTYSDLENNVEENNGEIIDVEEIQDTEIIDDTNKSDNLNEETKNSFNPFNAASIFSISLVFQNGIKVFCC